VRNCLIIFFSAAVEASRWSPRHSDAVFRHPSRVLYHVQSRLPALGDGVGCADGFGEGAGVGAGGRAGLGAEAVAGEGLWPGTPVARFFFFPGVGGSHSGVPPAPRINMM